MSTLKTNNFEHLDASSPNITLGIGGGVNISGIATAESGLNVTSGNLGIGTANPSGLLQVGEDGGSNVIITTNTGVDINDGTLNLYTATSNVNSAPFIISTDVGGTESEQFRVTGGGKLGIGTNSPAENVSVAGTIRVQDSTDATQYLTINHQGIDFQNTGAGSSTTATAHLLDDYEEGTFTPTLEGGTAYTRQDGFYTKIGSQVYFYIRIEASAATGNSNRWQVFGLPFASTSTDAAYGGAFRNYGDHLPGNSFANLNFHITQNATGIRAYNAQTTLLSNNSNITLTRQLILQGFYRTDS